MLDLHPHIDNLMAITERKLKETAETALRCEVEVDLKTLAEAAAWNCALAVDSA